MKPIILNEAVETGRAEKSQDIAQQLKSKMDHLKLNFFDLKKGGVNYTAMKGSEAFEAYEAATKSLAVFDLKTLATRQAKLAFWINIYNALVVHGVMALNVRKSVKEVSSFFQVVSYNIGGYTFSLDDIEHGILRRNKKKHSLARKPFPTDDPRKDFIVDRLDPRIHFALVCGSNSCPPVDVYEEAAIDEQLDLVSTGFVNSDEVMLEKESRTLKVSKLFKWYKEDFGGTEGLLDFVVRYRYNPDDKAFLKNNAGKLHIVYKDYDWSLNLV